MDTKLMNELNFAKIFWWWRFVCSNKWAPVSITKFGWEVKIKSVLQGDKYSMLVGSWISP